MLLNNKEDKIINYFLKNIDKYDSEEMKLVWHKAGSIIARFDTCFEDGNEFDEKESEYEEFITFVFEVIHVSGEPPVFITEDNFFCVNYHNFPDEILVGEKEISNNDWRLTNQMNYLYKKKLIKGSFKPYREGWEHEHCAFCSERIDISTKVAYSTEDRYHWICEDCFKDFKDMFEWN